MDLRYLSVQEVGGDYCRQMRFSEPDVCYVTICDVTGHGIGLALMATRVSSEVQYDIIQGQTPRETWLSPTVSSATTLKGPIYI